MNIYLGTTTDVGAIALAEALPRSRLAYLDLNGNPKITDIGGRALLAAIPRSNLVNVQLYGTDVSHSIQDAIDDAVAVRHTRNKLFLLLRLRFFGFTDEGNAMLHRVAGFLMG